MNFKNKILADTYADYHNTDDDYSFFVKGNNISLKGKNHEFVFEDDYDFEEIDVDSNDEDDCFSDYD